MTEKSSERLWLDGNAIHYTSPSNGSWAIPLADLLIFGEFTNGEGPFLVDYYFVFLTGPEQSYGASFYAEGREAFLKALGTHLGVVFEWKLVHSTDLASNVLWPTDIAGQPLYAFAEKPPTDIGARVLRWFGFGRVDVTYSKQVLAKLGERT